MVDSRIVVLLSVSCIILGLVSARPGVPINHSADGLTDALVKLASNSKVGGGTLQNFGAQSAPQGSASAAKTGGAPAALADKNPAISAILGKLTGR